MNITGIKGSTATSKIIYESILRGYNVSIPFESSARYDLIVDRRGTLLRVQCKHSRSDENVLIVKCCSGTGILKNRMKETPYTEQDIDYLVSYDSRTSLCYYLPISLISGKKKIQLRFTKPKNNQSVGIIYADQFLDW